MTSAEALYKPGSSPSAGFQHDAHEAAIVANQASTTIEPDTDTFIDESYDTDMQSNASTSLSPSVRNHAFENGRRYHKFREGRYVFPNDESEQDREDMKHAMIVNLCGGKLHFAPIGSNPQNILDVGTGTGIWCIDMGDEYPSASILGIDLSPIQPLWLPPNVRFLVDDAESAWLQSEGFYDFIHGRHIAPAIKDFPTLIQRAYSHLKPGGWFEIQEMHHLPHCDDASMPTTYPLLQYFKVITEGLRNLGVYLDASRAEASNLASYGFVNVRHEILKIPIGKWPRHKILKMVGLYARTGIMEGLHAMAVGPLTRGMGWTTNDVEVMLVNVRKCLVDESVHSYLPFHVIYGQKPLGGS